MQVDRVQIAANEGAGASTGDARFFLAKLVEQAGGVFRVANPVEKCPQDLAFNEPGGADLDGGKHLQQLLGGAGLELEELFEIATVIMGADRAGDGTADLVKAWKPGDGSGQRVFSS